MFTQIRMHPHLFHVYKGMSENRSTSLLVKRRVQKGIHNKKNFQYIRGFPSMMVHKRKHIVF